MTIPNTINNSININDLDQELNEVIELASLACHTPIALLTELENGQLNLKAQVGINIDVSDDFCALCAHCLEQQRELVAIADITKESAFKSNGLSYNGEEIKFYASAPLRTSDGTIYGAICIMDTEKREITAEQKQTLQILATKAIRIYRNRDQRAQQDIQIKNSAGKLRKLTDYAPGVIFQLELEDGKFVFPFVSKGISKINKELNAKVLADYPLAFLDKVLPVHRKKLLQSVKESADKLTEWRCEIQMINSENTYEWYIGLAKPERQVDGRVIWYGTFQNISARKNYETTLKQIVFDISHVLRKPVTTLMGLTALIQEDDLEVENIREFCKYINTTTNELELYTRTLNENYSKQKLTVLSKIG